MERLRPFFWRLVLLVIGMIIAVLFLTIGFWKTFLISLCCGTGYGIGFCIDKKISIFAIAAKFKLWLERMR